MRIEICGGLGSGKTTLATMLKSDSLTSVFENFSCNPFWKPFYLNPGQFAFETEITFLLQHYHQIKTAGDDIICDFSFFQDLAFAKMGLSGKRLLIFEDTAKECLEEVGYPDLTIYLQCPSNVLKERITLRARKEERNVTVDFLEQLNDSIYRELERAKSITNVVFLNSEADDFVRNQAIRDKLKDRITRFVQR